MTNVNADPQAIRQFQSSLKSFNQQLDGLMGRLKGQLRTLETSWPDSEGRKFAQDMQELISAISRYKDGTPELIQFLERKAEPLERYKGGR